MAPPVAEKNRTVLDLALELGVRSDAVLRAMNQIGASADDAASTIDPSLVSDVVQQLVQDGLVTSKLGKGKGRRKLTGEPIVDDEIMKEALGAGESGFSPSRIPRKILLEEEFEEPSFFQKWFGKKNVIARSLKEQDIDEDDLQSMFTSRRETERSAARASFDTPVEESPAEPEQIEAIEEEPALEEDVADIEVDVDILNDLDEIEMEGEPGERGEEDEYADLEDLEGLESLDEIGAGEMSVAETENLQEEGDEDLELGELDTDGDEEDLDMEGIEGELADMDEEELPPSQSLVQAPPPGFFERLFSKIQLSQNEMYAMMGSSIVLMLIVLGITIYWWQYKSQKAEEEYFEDAQLIFAKAEELKEEWINGENERKWDDVNAEYKGAVDGFTEFIERFPTSDRYQAAFQTLCECHYQIATGLEAAKKQGEMVEPYREMIRKYEKYLEFLHQVANEMAASTEDRAKAFVDPSEVRTIQLRIARANQKLKNFDVALNQLEDFVQNYRNYPEAKEAQKAVSEVYQDWAAINKENEMALLKQAIAANDDLLKMLPETDHLDRMNTFLRMGEILNEQYKSLLAADRPEEANLNLQEAMAYYEKAEAESRKDQDMPFAEKNKVFKKLADLYFLRGREAAAKWRDLDEQGNIYTDGNAHKQVLLDSAKEYKKTAEDFFDKSNKLYDELLQKRNAISSLDAFEAQYNKAEVHFIMQRYPETLASRPELEAAAAGLLSASPKRSAAEEHTTEHTTPSDHGSGGASETAHGEEHSPETDEHEDELPPQSSHGEENPAESAHNEEHPSSQPEGNNIKTYQAKVYYLLGNAAWEQAKLDSDYSLVKEYYRKALELDAGYPVEAGGEISHLAEIRLTNAYYMWDKQYESAIPRFQQMVNNYPKTGFTYLTLYYYGNALNDYADELNKEADQIEYEAKIVGTTPEKQQEAESKRLKAATHYKNAVDIYGRAIKARETSSHIDVHRKEMLIEITFKRGLCAYKAGNLREAENYLQEALNQFRNNEVAASYIPEAIEKLGDLNVQMANYPRAIQHYRDYIAEVFDDTHARVTLKLADAYLKQHSYEKGRELLERIIRNFKAPNQKDVEKAQRMGVRITRGPEFEAMKMLAASYEQQAVLAGDERENFLRKALESYQKLSDQFPHDPNQPDVVDDIEAMQKVANIHFELGNYTEAARNYNALLNAYPNHPQKGLTYYHMAECYIQLNQWDDAITALNYINSSSMANELQFADALILLGQAYESRANQFLKEENDGIMYEQYLGKAQQAYDRVAFSNIKDKTGQALLMRNNIDTILKNRKKQQAEAAP